MDKNNYIAHIGYDLHGNKDLSNAHSLKSHIEGVIELIAGFFETNNATSKWIDYAKLAALFHDIGKYQEAFQSYIRNDDGKRGTIKHSKYGAIIVAKTVLRIDELSLVIDAHHGNLKNFTEWDNKYGGKLEQSDEQIIRKAYQCLQQDIAELKNFIDNIVGLENRGSLKPKYSQLQREVIVRLIFSSLVDADWLDTERFMNIGQYNARASKPFDVNYLSTKLEEELKTYNCDGDLNKLRNETRLSVIAKASHSVGFFSLTLPTGLGKTLTSINWAIEHAKCNNLKRIIIVLPYTSIIDQNAQVLKRIFGDEYVLECHSNIQSKNHDEENQTTYRYDKQKLNSENFDSPIVITTTVQFFETLFSNNRMKCRKLHNIMNSVVIFDEVQILDKNIVKPTLNILKNMSSVFNCSFLFCTATMPAFTKRDNFDGIDNIISLIDEPASIFEKMKRVEYHLYNNLEESGFDELVETISEEKSSTLVVVNTKKKALEFYKALEHSANFDMVYHLSTNMYPKHRKDILSEIKEKLKVEKVLLISTQLVEAGVDLDFGSVYREVAPISSIIQAAGRCNREGKLKENGNVYIFALEDKGSPLGLYITETQNTAKLLKKERADILHKHDTFGVYYQMICDLYIEANDIITEDRKLLDFDTVAKSYKIIDENTQPVFILNILETNKNIQDIIDKIEKNILLNRNDYKEISQYSINMYDSAIARHFHEGLISEKNNILVWNSGYDEKYGIKLNNSDLDCVF